MKVECEVVSVVSDSVTLENITLLLVGNVELVGMLPLEPHCLLICRQVTAWHPTIAKYGLYMSEVFIKFEVGVSLLRGYRNIGILASKTTFEMPKRKRGCWAKYPTQKRTTVDLIHPLVL